MKYFMKAKDVTGERFGKLTAMYRSPTKPLKPAIWHFKCDCGRETVAYLGNVKSGKTTSCGCGRYGSPIANQRFGRLVAERYEDGFWVCLCDCGNTHRTTSTCLRIGNTRSCGCLRREATIARSTKHGMRRTPEFNVWANMRNRCNNPSNKSFFLYGGRGIKVCERWETSFENFYADMGPRPSPKHSIERVNNMLDYCPDNCKWGTPQEQANNRRNSKRYPFFGRMVTVRQAINLSGSAVQYSTVRGRVSLGYSLRQALNLPASFKLAAE